MVSVIILDKYRASAESTQEGIRASSTLLLK